MKGQKMKHATLLFLFVLSISQAKSQVFQLLDVPVVSGGIELANPWAGGLNAPQWSKADLDGDGKEDLYVFDRNGDRHLTFLNIGGTGEAKYLYAPHLAANFPECINFVLLRDYNRDGAMDIFAHDGDEGVPGIKVYKGRFENGRLAFERLPFNWDFNVLIIPTGGSFYSNLPVNPPDLPAIDDMDNDGDLDVLALNGIGSKVAYYKNIALEMGYTDDTLIFRLQDNCWGKLYVAPFSEQFTLSGSTDSCAVNFTAGQTLQDRGGLHGGATLCTFDADNDGDKELLYGDLIYPHLIFGRNGGTAANAWINQQDPTFPNYDVPANISDFAAAYYLDMDNDGRKDLMVCPNNAKNSFDRQVAWFYKNIQGNENPVFELQQKDFIVRDMLDFGSGAQPAFVDYNADGLMDLVVGNFNAWLPDFANDPFLTLFKNIGTPTAPKFEIVDNNWLNFKQFATEAYAFAPTFGDLDGDGDYDLLAGQRFGSLYYAENLAGPGNPMAFGPIQPDWKGINVGQYATPFIHDLNSDGLPDLIIGERNGNVNYLPNQGTPANPVFHPNPDQAPNNRFLGKINTQQPDYVTGYSAPVVLDFSDTVYVVTGSELGYLHTYIVNKDSLSGGAFKLVSKQFGDLREGNITRATFTDLNGDQFLDALIGNCRGGLGIFSSPITLTGTVPAKEEQPELRVEISPNPANTYLQIRLPDHIRPIGHYRIFNSLGQLVAAGSISENEARIETTGFSKGLYYIEIKVGASLVIKRFVKG